MDNSKSTAGTNRFFDLLLCAAFFTLIFARERAVSAAQCRTQNFVVTAATPELANRVAQCAEQSRSRLAKQWLGTDIQPWSTPCPIRVKCGPSMGAGGETTFTFMANTVTGWKMSVQGTEERLLDSVVPHEVSHTILATYFCRPVPRWIDEGAATSIEADVERNNYRSMLIGFLQEQRGIPFNTMVRLTEYPRDMMPFYSQGFSVCEYLIAVGGQRRLIEFAREAMDTGDWSESVKKYYGYEDLSDLQIRWTNWISQWHNSGHPSQLPEVAKVEDYPYDIYGRSIGGGTAVASNNTGGNAPELAMNNIPAFNSEGSQILRPSNPLNSFVGMPKSNSETDDDWSAAFDAGVGSASPESLVAESGSVNGGNTQYQGTYGHGTTSEPQNGPSLALWTPQDSYAAQGEYQNDMNEYAQAEPYAGHREHRGPRPLPPMPPRRHGRMGPPPFGPEPGMGSPTILGQAPPF